MYAQSQHNIVLPECCHGLDVGFSTAEDLMEMLWLLFFSSLLTISHNKLECFFSGLYYKPIMIVNDDSSVVNKLETSIIDNARVIIYNRHMFIVQDTG